MENNNCSCIGKSIINALRSPAKIRDGYFITSCKEHNNTFIFYEGIWQLLGDRINKEIEEQNKK